MAGSTAGTNRVLAAERMLEEFCVDGDGINALEVALWEEKMTDIDQLMRAIGRMLIREGRADLWRKAYDEYLAAVWPDEGRPGGGDEQSFLNEG